VLEAERLGYDSVWSGEAYGTDAVTPTAWILARTTRIRAGTGIMQMQARTPACTAMTALTLQALVRQPVSPGHRRLRTAGRRGWYGVPFGKPMARTREYIEILRKVLKLRGGPAAPGASSTRSPTPVPARPGSAEAAQEHPAR
jgi:alkanesulfonate monooxygenase SsuD/methylene tetrahydromethanopterin reductase-like flavin-dependent oxidoreductase (luciferase family)